MYFMGTGVNTVNCIGYNRNQVKMSYMQEVKLRRML